MFNSSSFNQNIANWDVSNVTVMSYMFAESNFNQDISNWPVNSVTDCIGFQNGMNPDYVPNFTNCTP
jgi:surface protein